MEDQRYAPMILPKGKKKYILEKMYPNHALYTDLDTGLKECFTFHELGMIEEMAEPFKEAYKGGEILWQNVK